MSDYLREAILKKLEESYTVNAFPTDPDQFEALSTIRYDPALAPETHGKVNAKRFFLLREHHSRLIFTLQYFKLHIAGNDDLGFEITYDFVYERLVEALVKSGRPLNEASKLRLIVKLDGTMRVEVYETPERENLLDGLADEISKDTWDVYLDKEATLISPFTSFKTTKRDVYSLTRERALPDLRPGREEAILFNSQNMVMEGSITNVAIQRDGKWITPQLSAGCICGVMRHFLLRKDYVEELPISKSDIEVGTRVLLFNGLMGVVQGVVVSL